MKVRYKCKDNDAIIQFQVEDGKIDEFCVKIEGDTSCIVVGYDDFNCGVRKAMKKCVPQNEVNFGVVNKCERPLKRPVEHGLIEIFRELKFGRKADDQIFLDKCIEALL